MSDTVRQFTVGTDDDGVRLDRWFKRHLPDIGFATISRWARTGQIRVDGSRAAPEDRLATGQVLRVPPGGLVAKTAKAPKPDRIRREFTPEELAQTQAMLLHTTPSAIVLNKPPGLATQGGTGTHEHVDGLLDAYAGEGAPRPRLVHRLDKDTSGVLLIARTPGSAAKFSKSFSGRTVRKIYWALVAGVPEPNQGEIDLPLAKQPGTGGEKMMVDKTEEGQNARTRYRVIERAGNRAAWVELMPLTGRTHQLRVHMAAIGHPIVGDGKYGGPDSFLTGSISRKMHLHARRLVIGLPEGGTLDVTAPVPEHFAASMAYLGFDESLGAPLPDAPSEPSREERKAAGRAHAKQYRKERRGERRRRDEPQPARDPDKPAGKPAAKAARPAAKSAAPGAKPGAKPAGKAAATGGRPAGKATTGARPAGPGGKPARPAKIPANPPRKPGRVPKTRKP